MKMCKLKVECTLLGTQVKKVAMAVPSGCPAPNFGPAWFSHLCEYMMVQQTPFIRRQVRKLLLFLCGSKEKYRQLRDFHALESHLAGSRAVCHGGVAQVAGLSYDALIVMVEHLKACTEVATSRTGNWQRFCQKDDTVLPFLFRVGGVSFICPMFMLQIKQLSVGTTRTEHGKGKQERLVRGSRFAGLSRIRWKKALGSRVNRIL